MPYFCGPAIGRPARRISRRPAARTFRLPAPRVMAFGPVVQWIE